MKLAEIDGNVYVSDSLLEEFENESQTDRQIDKQSLVYAENLLIGELLGFTFDGYHLTVQSKCSINPISLLSISKGSILKIKGEIESKNFIIEEVSYNVQQLSCSLKSILSLSEVTNER